MGPRESRPFGPAHLQVATTNAELSRAFDLHEMLQDVTRDPRECGNEKYQLEPSQSGCYSPWSVPSDSCAGWPAFPAAELAHL